MSLNKITVVDKHQDDISETEAGDKFVSWGCPCKHTQGVSQRARPHTAGPHSSVWPLGCVV